jgi:hypothetical protein
MDGNPSQILSYTSFIFANADVRQGSRHSSVQPIRDPPPGPRSARQFNGHDLDEQEREAAAEWGGAGNDTHRANGTVYQNRKPMGSMTASPQPAYHGWSESSTSTSDDVDVDSEVAGVKFRTPSSGSSPPLRVAWVASNGGSKGHSGPRHGKRHNDKHRDNRATSINNQHQDLQQRNPEAQAQAQFQRQQQAQAATAPVPTRAATTPGQVADGRQRHLICPFWVTYGTMCAKTCPFRHKIVPGLPAEKLECWFWRVRGRCQKLENCEFEHRDTLHGIQKKVYGIQKNV